MKSFKQFQEMRIIKDGGVKKVGKQYHTNSPYSDNDEDALSAAIKAKKKKDAESYNRQRAERLSKHADPLMQRLGEYLSKKSPKVVVNNDKDSK